jgi:hypothetical protein
MDESSILAGSGGCNWCGGGGCHAANGALKCAGTNSKTRSIADRGLRRRLRQARQASPSSFYRRTFSVDESGGKPPHSKMGSAGLDWRCSAATLRPSESLDEAHRYNGKATAARFDEAEPGATKSTANSKPKRPSRRDDGATKGNGKFKGASAATRCPWGVGGAWLLLLRRCTSGLSLC